MKSIARIWGYAKLFLRSVAAEFGFTSVDRERLVKVYRKLLGSTAASPAFSVDKLGDCVVLRIPIRPGVISPAEYLHACGDSRRLRISVVVSDGTARDCWGTGAEGVPARLFRLYGVSDMSALVAAQCAHIRRMHEALHTLHPEHKPTYISERVE